MRFSRLIQTDKNIQIWWNYLLQGLDGVMSALDHQGAASTHRLNEVNSGLVLIEYRDNGQLFARNILVIQILASVLHTRLLSPQCTDRENKK